MKKMIKCSLMISLIISFCYLSNAQTISIIGGLSLPKYYAKNSNNNYAYKHRRIKGFHAGINLEIPINSFLSLEPSILYSTKGSKRVVETYPFSMHEYEWRTHNIDFPLKMKLSAIIGETWRVYGVVGPYIGMGIAGKFKQVIDRPSGRINFEDQDIMWGDDNHFGSLQRLDMGLVIGAGVEFDIVSLSISYDKGLKSIYKSRNYTQKNEVLRISMGAFINQN
ncbi:MAG: PorT family protein [Chitinophagales bacterium]|nr:PorT family protein [Chitinophagales bacterium]